MAIAGYVGWRVYLVLYGPEALARRTELLLSQATLPQIEFRDATLEEAVDVYRGCLRDTGISNKVAVGVTPIAAGDARAKTASLELSNVPAIEAGKYIAEIFNLKFSIVGREARINRKEGSPLVHRSFWVNRGFIEPPTGVAKTFVINPDGSHDMRLPLQSIGVTFPKGAWAKYHPETERLDVYLDEENVALVDMLPHYPKPTWRNRLTDWLGF